MEPPNAGQAADARLPLQPPQGCCALETKQKAGRQDSVGDNGLEVLGPCPEAVLPPWQMEISRRTWRDCQQLSFIFRKREANVQQCNSGPKVLSRLVVNKKKKKNIQRGAKIKTIHCKTAPSEAFSSRWFFSNWLALCTGSVQLREKKPSPPANELCCIWVPACGHGALLGRGIVAPRA